MVDILLLRASITFSRSGTTWAENERLQAGTNGGLLFSRIYIYMYVWFYPPHCIIYIHLYIYNCCHSQYLYIYNYIYIQLCILVIVPCFIYANSSMNMGLSKFSEETFSPNCSGVGFASGRSSESSSSTPFGKAGAVVEVLSWLGPCRSYDQTIYINIYNIYTWASPFLWTMEFIAVGTNLFLDLNTKWNTNKHFSIKVN